MKNHTTLVFVSDKPLGMAGQWCAPVPADSDCAVVRFMAAAYAPTHIGAVAGAGSSDG
jgi:hypothetical protein